MLEVLLAATAMVVSVLVPPLPTATAPLVLLPERFDARVGENLGVRVESSNADALAWGSHPAAWCFLRVAGSQTNHDSVPGAAGLRVAGAPVMFALEHPGVTMIGVDFTPATAVMTSEQLGTVLETLVTPAERERVMKALAPDAPVRVRVVRSAKTLVRVLPADAREPAPPDAQTTGSKAGQVNEIRVMLDPLESLIGGDVNMRFHAGYDKAARTRGRATNMDTGKTQEFVSDASGIVLFHLDEPGRWRVEFSTARTLADDADADVTLFSASLTYAATRVEVVK